MDRRAVGRWLERYVAAWRANDRATIEELFSADAEYRYHPADEPLRGRTAIADSWLAEPDDPGAWDAWYEPYAVEDEAAVATGVSTYFDAEGSAQRVYDNVFVMRFDPEGRCTEFREWFVARPQPAD
jgi:hypothetical protein